MRYCHVIVAACTTGMSLVSAVPVGPDSSTVPRITPSSSSTASFGPTFVEQLDDHKSSPRQPKTQRPTVAQWWRQLIETREWEKIEGMWEGEKKKREEEVKGMREFGGMEDEVIKQEEMIRLMEERIEGMKMRLERMERRMKRGWVGSMDEGLEMFKVREEVLKITNDIERVRNRDENKVSLAGVEELWKKGKGGRKIRYKVLTQSHLPEFIDPNSESIIPVPTMTKTEGGLWKVDGYKDPMNEDRAWYAVQAAKDHNSWVEGLRKTDEIRRKVLWG